jgi:hypothetical protein
MKGGKTADRGDRVGARRSPGARRHDRDPGWERPRDRIVTQRRRRCQRGAGIRSRLRTTQVLRT